MGTKFEGSDAEKMMKVLAVFAEKDRKEITFNQYWEAIHDTHPKIAKSNLYSIMSRLKSYKMLVPTGARIGNSKVYMIMPEPENVIKAWRGRGSYKVDDARARARAHAEKSTRSAAPVKSHKIEAEKPATQFDHEAMDLGLKVYRSMQIMMERTNAAEAKAREAEQAKNAVVGLQRENDKLRKENDDYKKHSVTLEKHRALLNKYNALEKRVDEQNKIIKQAEKITGSGVKLKDVLNISRRGGK